MYGFHNGVRGHGIRGWLVWWSGLWGYDDVHKVHVGIVGEYPRSLLSTFFFLVLSMVIRQHVSTRDMGVSKKLAMCDDVGLSLYPTYLCRGWFTVLCEAQESFCKVVSWVGQLLSKPYGGM